jgi:hypothetical protein
VFPAIRGIYQVIAVGDAIESAAIANCPKASNPAKLTGTHSGTLHFWLQTRCTIVVTISGMSRWSDRTAFPPNPFEQASFDLCFRALRQKVILISTTRRFLGSLEPHSVGGTPDADSHTTPQLNFTSGELAGAASRSGSYDHIMYLTRIIREDIASS